MCLQRTRLQTPQTPVSVSIRRFAGRSGRGRARRRGLRGVRDAAEGAEAAARRRRQCGFLFNKSCRGSFCLGGTAGMPPPESYGAGVKLKWSECITGITSAVLSYTGVPSADELRGWVGGGSGAADSVAVIRGWIDSGAACNTTMGNEARFSQLFELCQ